MSREPQVNLENQFFWDGVERGEFRIQRCSSCGKVRFPPRPMCPDCQSLDWDSIVARGDAEVYSFVRVFKPHPEEFPDDGYLVALLELPEGIRFVATPRDLALERIEIGAKVRLEMAEVEPGVKLPVFDLA